jgi:2-iminobutanoate/2-iminopropanoate deaminase
MARNIISTLNAPKPPPTYSQAVVAGGLIFVSGTGPYDVSSGGVVGSTIQEQCRQCLTNIAAILEAAGSSLTKIVSATVILLDEEDFAGMNEWSSGSPQTPLLAKVRSCQCVSLV